MKKTTFFKKVIFVCLCIMFAQTTFAQQNSNEYLNRFLLLRDKINNPANGYFSTEGLPYHSPETLICEAPDYGHETTSEAYSYWIWLEAMYGRIKGDWAPLNSAWNKMETYAIPSTDQQPTAGDYKPSAPATYASEFGLPSQYPATLQTTVPVGKDPLSPELTSTYGNSNVYGMHWLFDLDNFYGFGNKGDGTSKASYINTFQRGVQESVWETVPQPSWESFNWGSNDGSGFLKLFVADAGTPAKQWKYTNAPDADARVVQAMYWATQWTKDQGLNPAATLPLDKTKKMGDYLRLAMFDKYFKPMGVQNINGAGGTGYDSAHYLMSWYYAWGGPLTSQGWAWRIGCSHNHFGYQNPVAAYALSATTELKPLSPNASRDWGTSLTRQIELYQWLQSAEGAIAGGATNSWNGKYDPYPAGTPTFYGMAYVENPVYEDPGSNTWFGFQAWSVERVAEYYYLTNNARAKSILDKWIPWVKSVTHLLPNGSYEIPSEIGWTGKPNTWTPASPVANTGLHVNIVSYTQDVGVTAALAKTLTYYAAATQKYATLDTASRDLAKSLLDRMWTNYYEVNGRGVATTEARGDFKKFFDQEVFVPAGWTGKMPNGDVIKPGIKFIDIRSKYRNDPDFPALQAAYSSGTDFVKKYHRFWAQTDVALANAEYGYFFNTVTTPSSIITASAGANGTISPVGAVSLPNGTSKTFTITPNAGFQIDAVLVNGTSVGAVATYTFTNVIANQTISATFKVRPPLVITASAGTNGTISPTGAVSVASGTNKTFTITPNAGFQIDAVLVNGTSVGAVATYTFTNVIANQTISATFKATTSPVITASAGANGTISPTGAVSVPSGTNKTFTITPNAGFQIDAVLVNGTSVGAVATYTFTNVVANQTISATFKATTSPVITASAGANGTISPTGAVNVPSGTNKTFTITPNAGFQIDAVLVNGTSVGAVATYTFTNVVANQTISATFKPVIVGGNCLLTRFGVPRATALPDGNASYSKVYTLGTGGPNLSNVTNAVINWSLSNNGLWQLSFNTNNGIPTWWLDMRNNVQNFAQPQPAITFAGTGIAGLDGNKYYINYEGSNVVFVEVTGKHAVYFSNSATPPVGCTTARITNNNIVNGDDSDIKIAPNPASNFLKLNFSKNSAVKQMVMYDVLGRVVLEKDFDIKQEEHQVDISKLSSGTYKAIFNSELNTWVKNVIKQ
jgi:Glycosyl hydrolase family 48/Secretion system C-terminal sorting domain/Divergent InlB B-repeat domain